MIQPISTDGGLVLSRRAGEEIVLPGLGIVVRVMDTTKHRTRIRVQAPKDVKIMRRELLNQEKK